MQISQSLLCLLNTIVNEDKSPKTSSSQQNNKNFGLRSLKLSISLHASTHIVFVHALPLFKPIIWLQIEWIYKPKYRYIIYAQMVIQTTLNKQIKIYKQYLLSRSSFSGLNKFI